jgi:DNA (cytosine-5)-methyltransferase 1
MSITIGSLFAGIGGFELGLERAIPNSETIWQVEQEPFCQRVLEKHWPHAQRFDDVRDVGAHNLSPVDIICGGFPCQDISVSGKREGINGQKSSLWFEMLRIIRELRPAIAVMENVNRITFRGLSRVLGDLAEIGYGAEWRIVSAQQFGAPHNRQRWFCVAYPNGDELRVQPTRQPRGKEKVFTPNDGKERFDRWGERAPQSTICGVDDGLPQRLHKARLRALGNAIVPQCSQWIGEQILESGLLDKHVYLEPRADFETCIVSMWPHVTYSADMIIEMLMQKQGWSYDDALEWFCYNIETPQTKDWPLFVWEE